MKDKKKLTEEEKIEIINAKRDVLKYIDNLKKMNEKFDKILGKSNSTDNGVRQ
jgi:hypothetical protein